MIIVGFEERDDILCQRYSMIQDIMDRLDIERLLNFCIRGCEVMDLNQDNDRTCQGNVWDTLDDIVFNCTDTFCNIL